MQQLSEKPLKGHVSILVLAVNSDQFGVTRSYSSCPFLCTHHDYKKINNILHQGDKVKTHKPVGEKNPGSS